MQPPMGYGATPQFSKDGKWWWDGTKWISILSQDGRYRWTGKAWAPVRKMFLGDYANESIASAIVGLFCALLLPYGIYAGYKAYQELPWKRTQAMVGMIINTVLFGLWLITLIYRFAIAPSLR